MVEIRSGKCPGQKPRSKLTRRKEQDEKLPAGLSWVKRGIVQWTAMNTVIK